MVKTSLKKFLIINPFGIGDVIFTTPVILTIKEKFPDSSIYYWCNERVEAIFRHDTNIAMVIPFSRGDIKKLTEDSVLEGMKKYRWLYNTIKSKKIDIALDYSLDYRYSLISFFCGIKKRVGFDYRKRGRFLTDKIPIDGYSERHVIEYYLDLLILIGITTQCRKQYLVVAPYIQERVRQRIEAFGVQEKDLLVAIAPGAGASWGKDAKLKHWSPVKYAQLADRIIQECGARVVVLGDEHEKDITEMMVKTMKNNPIDMSEKTSLEELIALISNASLLITNDGGPLHIAAALGIKTVSLFGPVDERVYGAYPPSPLHRVIKCNLECRPCYNNFRLNPCLRERECITSISVDEVFAQVRNQL
ncbi:MAG: glycosyltransferase family 9 protein [Candidatus Omnitrophica bacterium]|nr:glycosyltransferase family 9 protein [Candidatus Omnitrophota bacterium]